MTSGCIYVDIDDCLGQTARMFAKVFEQEYGRRVDVEEIESFDLGVSLGLTPESLDDFMKSVHRPEVLAEIQPMNGAVETLAAWVDRGYEVAVVTGRPPGTEAVSRQWLTERGVPHHSLTFLDKYSWSEDLFGGSQAISMEELSRRSFSLVVEDSAEVARRLASVLDAPVALLDRPWNRSSPRPEDELKGRIFRCRDWQDIGERFSRP
ncbi:MAG: bifunctional metallophosphatase/5'-nucleotidase [Thermoanaerobaculia bacterium]